MKVKQLISIFFITFILGTGFALPIVSVFAQTPTETQYTPLAPIPQLKEGNVYTYESFVTGAVELAIGIAGLLAVVMIIWGGIEYITTENITGKGAAKRHIQNAIIGLLLALAAYLILRTINPALVGLTNINSIPNAPLIPPPAGPTVPETFSLGAYKNELDNTYSSVICRTTTPGLPTPSPSTPFYFFAMRINGTNNFVMMCYTSSETCSDAVAAADLKAESTPELNVATKANGGCYTATSPQQVREPWLPQNM